MELSEETLKTIGSYVKGNLAEWMREVGPPVPATDPRLLERMVRVEESLEHQRELMERGFARNDQHFEELRREFDARLGQIDKRLEQQRQDFLARFEQVDKRLEQVDKRLEGQREEFRAQMRRLTAVMTTIMSILTVFVGYGTFIG
jgi:ABC-type phosphate transport system auxiliary subunit